MASINKILGNNLKNSALNKVSYVAQMIHYSKFQNSAMQFYDFSREKSETMADNIELAGAVHEPVIARQLDADKYEILSGHKRIAAVKILVEERGLDKYAMVPAHIIKVDDYMAEYILISTNDYPEKSDYERMMEVVRLYETLPMIKAEECTSARVLRRMVAREASMCETRVGNFKNIYNHFSEKSMAAFKEKKFGINVAIKLASLPENEQNILTNRERLTISDINEYLAAKVKKPNPKTGANPECEDEAKIVDQPDGMEVNTNGEEFNSSNTNARRFEEYDDSESFSFIDDTAEGSVVFENEPNLQANEKKRTDCDLNNSTTEAIALQIIKESKMIAKYTGNPTEQMRSKVISTAVQFWLDRSDRKV